MQSGIPGARRAIIRNEAIRAHLESLGVAYTVHNHRMAKSLVEAAGAAGLDPEAVARAVLLSDDHGYLVAVLRATDLLDFASIESALNRKLIPVPINTIVSRFEEWDQGSVPPIADLYQLDAIIDQRLLQNERIYFEPGVRNQFVEVDVADFDRLMKSAWHGEFTCDESELATLDPSDYCEKVQSVVQRLTPNQHLDQFGEAFDLPVLPDFAEDLLEMQMRPYLNPNELTSLLLTDADIMQHLQHFAYFLRGKEIDGLESLVEEVLGKDVSLNLAMGVSIIREFPIAPDGPLGMHEFWRHAVYSAILMPKICALLSDEICPPESEAVLAGLLQNLGRLLVGELFPAEIFLLNRFVSLNREIIIEDLEKQVIGTKHTVFGEWLMTVWDLPKYLQVVAANHHKETYDGACDVIAKVALINNRLLKYLDIGDESTSVLPLQICDELDLLECDLYAARDEVSAQTKHIEQFVNLPLFHY